MGDDLPDYKGRLPMARPGYTIPPQKTDIELFGAPERPRGWTIGPPSKATDDISGLRSHPPTNAPRSPTVVPVTTHNHQSPFVSPVPLNQGADASTFAFGNVSGAPGPTHLPTQTPRKLARPIGSQPADFEPQPISTKTPKTPFAPMTPRVRRPLGAPAAELEEITPAITPFIPASKPFTPKMQRPTGAPTGSPELGALPPEDLAIAPVAQTKPPMRRPGMPSWDSVPKVDTFQMMGGPASQSHHFSTPGPAHRPLPGHQQVTIPRAANTPQPVIPNFEKPAQQPGQGWRTGPMPVAALPPSSPGQTRALLDEAVDVWGRQPMFRQPGTPNVNPPSPAVAAPIIPTVPPAPVAPPAPEPFEAGAGALDEAEPGFDQGSSSANKNRNKKARAKAKKAAAKGKTTPGGPQPDPTLVRATSAEGKSSPNSKPVGIPNLTFTVPSPSVSPAPPDSHTDAPLVRPTSGGAGGSTRNVTHIAGPFVTPPSPARTNKSQKPTVEEVTDDDTRRRTPSAKNARNAWSG